ncbi:MAG: aminotransferase class I/II-fold pyridoxal phosphate-dependent enzyme [Candidatus Heimdallarchaeota archaeon]|nr:MAG: aminotransferase class I/II-fold pyridoxal phosphate-dependent enzyme [Candidatus Heimdallarchaeota archaeon]
MTFKRMLLEEWFDKYQFDVDYDIGESGVKFLKLGELDLNLNEVELRYTHHLGNPELRTQIASFYEKLGWDNIAVTTGAAESIFSIMASLTSKKDHIIVECPNYPSFWYIPQSLERSMDLFFLDFEERFKPNFQKLEDMIKPNTKLICLTHPNNPTGSIITIEELKQIIDIVEDRNIYLLLDETYRELTFGKVLPPAANLSSNVISVSTMSKVYGLPGIRVGWSASLEKTIIDGILKVREQTTICNSALNEAIALQILRKKDRHLKTIMQRIKENYNIVFDWMEDEDRLSFIPPKGSVTCFPRFNESSERLCRLLVEKYRTFTVPGYCFKMDHFFRLGFGGETEELEKGLEKLSLAIKEM